MSRPDGLVDPGDEFDMLQVACALAEATGVLDPDDGE